MSELPDHDDVINFEDAARRIPGGIDGVKQMAPDLMRECTQQLESVRTAYSAHDADKLRLAAHTIKGSAAVFSASRVADAALVLEQMGRSGSLDAAQVAIEELAVEIELLGRVLGENSAP